MVVLFSWYKLPEDLVSINISECKDERREFRGDGRDAIWQMGQYLYRYIFNGMNIHKSQLFWGEQKVPGFWLIAIWQMDCKWKVDEGRLQCTYPTPFATDDLSGHQRGASRFSMGFNLAKAAQDGGFHWWLKVADSKPRTRQFWSDSM